MWRKPIISPKILSILQLFKLHSKNSRYSLCKIVRISIKLRNSMYNNCVDDMRSFIASSSTKLVEDVSFTQVGTSHYVDLDV